MNFTLVVSCDREWHLPGRRALAFATALVGRSECHLKRVFFYANGVASAMEDEYRVRWQVLSDRHNFELILCSASADRLSVGQAPEGFEIAGLGTLIEAGVDSDRVMTFV